MCCLTQFASVCRLFVLPLLVMACDPVPAPVFTAPYEPSQALKTVVIDWSSHRRLAPGSDNWPLTWAADDSQYTSWGDGGGFGGSNYAGRVSLGVARIDGGRKNYTGHNLWGGFEAAAEGDVDGKSYGILSLGKTLYLWVSPGSNEQAYIESRLYVSENGGKHWQPLQWAFDRKDNIVNPAFAQFGRDYAGARDDYVYIYASRIKDDSALTVQTPGEIILMRVQREALTDRSRYEFFQGYSAHGQPQWTLQMTQAQPVFTDPNGVGWNLSVSWNAGLQKYFLMTEHAESMAGYIGIFDAPEPWGPWTTVYYGQLAPGGEVQANTFYYNFSNKWLSDDGQDFVLVFTGINNNDSWNTVEGRFELFGDSTSGGNTVQSQ